MSIRISFFAKSSREKVERYPPMVVSLLRECKSVDLVVLHPLFLCIDYLFPFAAGGADMGGLRMMP